MRTNLLVSEDTHKQEPVSSGHAPSFAHTLNLDFDFRRDRASAALPWSRSSRGPWLACLPPRSRREFTSLRIVALVGNL